MEYEVLFGDIGGGSLESVAKVVIANTGMALTDVLSIINHVGRGPVVLRDHLNKEEAQKLVDGLTAAGATASVARQKAIIEQREPQYYVRCPVCGYGYPAEDIYLTCAHLIADYADGSDGDRGILATDSRSMNHPLRGLEALKGALTRLVRRCWGIASDSDAEDSDPPEITPADLRRLKELLGPVLRVWGLNEVVECIGYESLPTDFTMTSFEEVLTHCPNVSRTSQVLGGMTSSNVTFIWASDPSRATDCIEQAIASATEDAEAAVAVLEDARWRIG